MHSLDPDATPNKELKHVFVLLLYVLKEINILFGITSLSSIKNRKVYVCSFYFIREIPPDIVVRSWPENSEKWRVTIDKHKSPSQVNIFSK